MELGAFIDLGEGIDVNPYSHGMQMVHWHNESVGTIRFSSLGITEHLWDGKQERLPKAQLFSIFKWSWAVLPLVLIGIEWEHCRYLNGAVLNSSWTTLRGPGISEPTPLQKHFCRAADWWKVMNVCIARGVMRVSKLLHRQYFGLIFINTYLGVISSVFCRDHLLLERNLQHWIGSCCLISIQ